MRKIVECGLIRATSREERIGATTTPNELLVSSPASVIGPNTLEASANRRMGQKFLISDAESCDKDCDDEKIEFVSYDVVDMIEEPVAISRVRALALAKRCIGRESKVTLESARAKLDCVKATRDKHLKKRKLENFLSGHVDAGMNFILPSEFQGQSKVVQSNGFSVEKARAKLEAFKIKKELDITNVSKHMNMYITSSPGRTTRIASQACSIDEELSHEGVWVRQAKMKLEAAREKTLKSNRKRKSKPLGTKKRNKPEESNTKIRSDLSRTREETEATSSEMDTKSSAVSLESTSSVELTPPTRRRKTQQLLVDIIPPPGARLSSGVECVPPVSPYGLIQEHLYQDPWKVLVSCILLNQTGGRQMHKVIWDFFELCPDAETCVSTETERIGRVIRSLGLQNKRAKTLQRFSQDYLGTTWINVTQLHGIGEYARDAYAIFCEGRWQDVQPNDLVLSNYWRWLSDTQGLGYGFSQIE